MAPEQTVYHLALQRDLWSAPLAPVPVPSRICGRKVWSLAGGLRGLRGWLLGPAQAEGINPDTGAVYFYTCRVLETRSMSYTDAEHTAGAECGQRR